MQVTGTSSQVAVPQAHGCLSKAAMSKEKATVRVFPVCSLPLRGFLYCLRPVMTQKGLSLPSQVCIGTLFQAPRLCFYHLRPQRELLPTDVPPHNNHNTPRNIYHIWFRPSRSVKPRRFRSTGIDETTPNPISLVEIIFVSTSFRAPQI